MYFKCDLDETTASALNRESGRIYTRTLAEHYRIFRKHNLWLSQAQGEKLIDAYEAGIPRLLHAHSVDAAQQGFYKACKMARANRHQGAHYPHKRKYYRTTIWKNTAIRQRGELLLLSLARGLPEIEVNLSGHILDLGAVSFQEMRLVFNKASKHYEWHLVVEDHLIPERKTEGGIAAGDLGEVHPIALTDGEAAAVISCRQLRAQNQHTNYILAQIQKKQACHQKHSRRWWRIERRKRRFLEKQALRKRDLEHKISHEVIEWCEEHQVRELALGDVRDIADGKRLRKEQQQKISNWSHGKLRRYIQEKAQRVGIRVMDDVDEAHTSRTCPFCSHQHKPQGRIYRCANPACGAVAHRDVVGAANILSRHRFGTLARVQPPPPMYRHPVLRGKRSSVGHAGNSS